MNSLSEAQRAPTEDKIHLNKEVRKWLYWYSQERSHQALNYCTPEAVYWEKRLSPQEA